MYNIVTLLSTENSRYGPVLEQFGNHKRILYRRLERLLNGAIPFGRWRWSSARTFAYTEVQWLIAVVHGLYCMQKYEAKFQAACMHSSFSQQLLACSIQKLQLYNYRLDVASRGICTKPLRILGVGRSVGYSITTFLLIWDFGHENGRLFRPNISMCPSIPMAKDLIFPTSCLKFVFWLFLHHVWN